MNRYEQIKTLGQGAYGEAILAKRKDDGKLVVMKQVRLTKLKPADRAAAFQEATVLASLNHPFIVSYVDKFEENNCLYIVMEYADGGDLAGKLEKRGGKLFEEDEVLRMFIQIALALNYVHNKHILHRDLKTQNVFLTKDGTIKLGDFGIAKVLQHSFQLAKTRIGTPYYLSPEICEGKGYNSKTDVWSLGCILYELCTLKHAFHANNLNQLLMNIIRGRVSPIPSKFSQNLRTLVEALLQKDPAQRPSVKQILQLPFIKERLSDFLSDRLVSYDRQHMEMSGKAAFTEKTSSLKEKTRADEALVREKQRQMMVEVQRRQEEAEMRRRKRAQEEEQQRKQLVNDMYMRQREEVLENKRRAQRDIWGHNPVFDMQEPGAEEERYPKERRSSKQEIDLEERKRIAREQREEAKRNRERVKALEAQGDTIEALKGFYSGDDSAAQETTKHETLKKRAPTMDENDMKEMQRQLRREARENREKQMAAAKDLDMDKLVAEAEAEQRKERKRLKRAKSTDQAKKPSDAEIDMNKLVAEAEAEIRRNKRKQKGEDTSKKLEDHEKLMDVVFQQASAIMEALDMKDTETHESTDENEPATPFFVGGQELTFPEVKDSDSLMYRSESIRAYLEKQLGLDKLLTICNLMSSEKAKPEEVEKELSDVEPGLVVLLQQLIVLDEKMNH